MWWPWMVMCIYPVWMNHNNVNLRSVTPSSDPSRPKYKAKCFHSENNRELIKTLTTFAFMLRIQSRRFGKANFDTKWHKNSVKGGKAIMMNQTEWRKRSVQSSAMALLNCILKQFMSHLNKMEEQCMQNEQHYYLNCNLSGGLCSWNEEW